MISPSAPLHDPPRRRGSARGADARLAVILLCAALCAVPAAGAEKISLRLRPPAGKRYNMRFNYDQRTSRGREGEKEEMRQTFVMDYVFRVEGVDAAGTVSVRATNSALRYAQSGTAGSVSWDSDHPSSPAPPPVAALAPRVGQSFLMKVTSGGVIEESEGFDSEIIKAVMAVYPDKPVGVGDSWKRKITVSGGLPIVMDNTFTLVDRRRGVAVVAVRGDLQEGFGPTSLEFGPLKLGYDISGTQKGKLEMEEPTGWPLRGNLDQFYSGQFRLAATELLGGGVSSPIEVTSTIIVEPF